MLRKLRLVRQRLERAPSWLFMLAQWLLQPVLLVVMPVSYRKDEIA